LHQELAFYLNAAKDMIPGWKEGDVIQFGIAILPEGHQLRGSLPEIIASLRSAALLEVHEFLKAPRFQVDKSSQDLFIGYLKSNPAVFDKLLDGWDGREPFDKWRAEGMPNGVARIKKPRIPFFLWDDSDWEIKNARLLYDAEQNCVKVAVSGFYYWVSKRCPLFGSFSYYGISDVGMVEDMIEYMKFKLGVKSDDE
jgi:hypothetical protein